MTRTKLSSSSATSRGRQVAAPVKVSVQAMYSAAWNEVMANPGKAIAEHDPGLALLQTLIRTAPEA
jgi:hypothetical protein